MWENYELTQKAVANWCGVVTEPQEFFIRRSYCTMSIYNSV